MGWYEWIFDGVGTALIGFISGLISYKAAVKKMSKQSQTAGDNSQQKQEAYFENENGNKNVQSNITQIQEAGDNAEQIQCGGFGNGKK